MSSTTSQQLYLLVTVIALVAEDGVLVADVLLGELPVLVRRVKAAEPRVVVMIVIEGQAETLIPVTRLMGQIGPWVGTMLSVPVCTLNVYMYIICVFQLCTSTLYVYIKCVRVHYV